MSEQFVQISPKMLRPRLPRLGNIKIGGKGAERPKRNGKGTFRLPVKFDHFEITKRARDSKTENFVRDEEIHRKIGAKPTELPVRLLFDEPEQNFQTSLVAYDGTKRRCQGNGERAVDREIGEIVCPCPLLKQFEGKYEGPKRPSGVICKPYGVLSVLLEARETYGGFDVFRTTSWETISNITAALKLFREQFGGLAFIPLKLRIYAATDTYDDNGEQKTSTSWKVAIVLAASMETAFQIAAGAREQREHARQLGSGQDYSPEAHAEQLREIAIEDEAEDAEEFYVTESPTVEAELEEEPHPLEAVCRRAMEIAEVEATKINQTLAEFADREVELGEKLQKKIPDAWAKALEEAQQAELAEQEEVVTVAANDGDDLDLFGS